MRLIYISGPYSSYWFFGRLLNIYRSWKIAKHLWKAGYAVLCPHTNTAFMDEIDYGKFIVGDLEMLCRCDSILMLKDWRESKGARLEHSCAESVGMPVFYQVEDLE